MGTRPLTRRLAAVAVLALGAGVVTLLPGAAPPALAGPLVPYEDCDALLEHYRAELERSATPWGFGGHDVADGVAVAAEARGAADESAGSGPTGTNLQERGVDEPDLAKTSGDLLIALSQGRLHVVRAAAQPELLSSTALGGETWGGELLVDGPRVLVLLPQSEVMPVEPGPASVDAARAMPVHGGSGQLRMLLFDLAEPTRPQLLDEAVLDGRYLSARLAGGVVRLVTSSPAEPEAAQPQQPYGSRQEQAALDANRRAARTASLAEVLPQLSRNGETRPAVACSDVRHTPSPDGTRTLLVSTLDLTRGLAPVHTTGVTTDGELVYASAERLYVATSRWGTGAPAPGGPQEQVTTELHGFDLRAPDRAEYVGTGSVPGHVLGRWALSSHEGHLRVATTDAGAWDGSVPSVSRVVVLAEEPDGLRHVGEVGGLGVGERIYAVRYFGDLATVVTFRQTDPLYVLDLSRPQQPALLGELKIPGFSTYLHPVGDDLLLGVGMDADLQGRVTGAQVSLFDLSDRSRPLQRDRLALGQGWTAAGQDSRAFGWDAQRRLALLPWVTHDGRESSSALAVRVSDDGRLVHAGSVQVPDGMPVERVLHDGSRAYVVTRAGVVAADLDGLTRTGEVRFPR